jgi:hypothetical protein
MLPFIEAGHKTNQKKKIEAVTLKYESWSNRADENQSKISEQQPAAWLRSAVRSFKRANCGNRILPEQIVN